MDIGTCTVFSFEFLKISGNAIVVLNVCHVTCKQDHNTDDRA